MKIKNFAARLKSILYRPKIILGAAIVSLVVPIQLATISGPAHAIAIYAQQNGNIPCSTCHSRAGLANSTMYPLTNLGTYFKTYKRLPPVPGTPPPVVSNPPPVYNPPPVVNNPPPVYNPPPLVNNPPPIYNPPPVRNAPRRSAHVVWCSRKYRSYKERSDTYRGYDGYDHRCVSPYRGGARAAPPVRRPVVRNPVLQRPVVQRPLPRTNQTRNFSCGQAKGLLRRRGFHNIRAKNCNDRGRYTFFASRGGAKWRIRVRASNGALYKITPR